VWRSPALHRLQASKWSSGSELPRPHPGGGSRRRDGSGCTACEPLQQAIQPLRQHQRPAVLRERTADVQSTSSYAAGTDAMGPEGYTPHCGSFCRSLRCVALRHSRCWVLLELLGLGKTRRLCECRCRKMYGYANPLSTD
jgi:hypothetical protein